MEFQGRITKLLPMRSGTSQRTGNEWKSLPFIFEYFEHDSDRYADSVMLETFDTKVIDNLQEGMEVICGFGHKTREYTKDGKKMVINDIRLYKIESVRSSAQGTNTQAAAQQHIQQQIVAPQPQNNEGDKTNDLPF